MNYYKYLDGKISLIGNYDDREDAQVDANCVDPDWLFILDEDQLIDAYEVIDEQLVTHKYEPGMKMFLLITEHYEFEHAGEYYNAEQAGRAFKDDKEIMGLISEDQAASILKQVKPIYEDIKSSVGPSN